MATTRTAQMGRTNAMRPMHALSLSRRFPVDLAVAVVLTVLSALASAAPGSNAVSAETMSAQMRLQGYACARHVTVVRNEAASEPGMPPGC